MQRDVIVFLPLAYKKKLVENFSSSQKSVCGLHEIVTICIHNAVPN